MEAHASLPPPATAADPASPEARAFDLGDLIHLEEMFLEEGREEGVADGLRAGRPEGFTLGLEKGFELLAEVAYYEACAAAWLDAAQAVTPVPIADGDDDEETTAPPRTVLPARAAKTLTSFLALVATFPRENRLDTGILELLERIRGKWKLVCAVAGVPAALAAYSAAWTPLPVSHESEHEASPAKATNALGVPVTVSQSLSF
ncbi:enolase-phosphatase E1 [Blastocladiella emersonii ATCC 22665]|nr:enolase-phosphatase E1 [Blastocladiella emersonii ATCC 22665]